MWDWAVYTSEVLRTRYDLVWKMRPGGKWHDAGKPYLGGIENVHKDYGLTFVHAPLNRIQEPDYLPPLPIQLLNTRSSCAAGTLLIFPSEPAWLTRRATFVHSGRTPVRRHTHQSRLRPTPQTRIMGAIQTLRNHHRGLTGRVGLLCSATGPDR